MLGLSAHVRACLLDLAGVLTGPRRSTRPPGARGVHLPEGSPEDPREAETVNGLGNRKSELVLRRIPEEGMEPYDGSGRFVHPARAAGLRCVAPEAARALGTDPGQAA
ncbi:hypothetical protein [Streptomyces sp. NPDC002078]